MEYRNKLFFTFILMLGLFFSSCQKEESEVVEIIPENTHQIDSQLVHLIRSMSMNNGSVDNFIDGYDCFSIAFPYDVLVDSIQVNVSSQSDYANVADVIAETEANFEDIQIVFPITIILSDYSEIYINNGQELSENLTECNAINIGIDCLDINYPLTLFVYNSEIETTNSYMINNDIEMYSYLSNMTEEDYISIEFPMSVTTQSNEIIQVENDSMLQVLIDACVEEEIDPNTLTEYLINGDWFVNFSYQGIDTTSNFCEYYIDFNVNGSMIATNGVHTVNGMWNIGYEGDEIYVEFIFNDEAPFNELNDKWFINSYNPEVLGFEKPGDIGTIDLLTINHIPTGC